ncbi:tripartite tricarboxylate transporter substrate binding protein [Bordetella petrii]|uniref:tripartite tricarboxylate transporter substrate binding protein n=1 Tax=Bordetella petrii TaxID=94624 RepID=UPI001E3D1C2E|nr:tripartite tricarboxylate transporter substrate binding protein [Bordetella petrii]MCD0501610.1 tripartite tricarboxylate transporter substrate binding protein [Bordetella petrii]
MRKHKLLGAALFAALTGLANVSAASDVVKMIIPTAPGGGTDSLFRAIARYAEPYLDATLVVQNAGGAGGAIGVGQLARAKPDGLTMAGVWMGPITVAPHSIDTTYGLDDYIPVIQLDAAPYVLCVRSDFPANNGKELLDQLKAKPGHYTFGTDGVAGPGQLAAERVFQAFGVKARDIPYRGAGETMPALLGKVVDIYVGSVPPAAGLDKKGDIKCLLATGADPVKALPRATTLTELGIPEKETLLWHGIVVPAGTPDAAVERIADAFEKAADSPEMAKFFETAGVEKKILRRKEFTQHIRKEYAELGDLVKTLGLKKQ